MSYGTFLSVIVMIVTLTLNAIIVIHPINAQTSLGSGSLNITENNNTVSSQPHNVSATILPGAGALGEKAFSPNPINITLGETVIWTNDDDSSPAFHTVTSGNGASDPNLGNEFDSGLAGPHALLTKGTTFSHTFGAIGEFPYFCQLHPTMVGKVIVSN